VRYGSGDRCRLGAGLLAEQRDRSFIVFVDELGTTIAGVRRGIRTTGPCASPLWRITPLWFVRLLTEVLLVWVGLDVTVDVGKERLLWTRSRRQLIATH
jgi:hypothetical protein